MGILKRANLTYPEKKEQNAGAVPADSFPLCSLPCEHSAEKPCGTGKAGALAESLGSSFILKADTNNMGYYEYRTGDGYS